MAATVRFWNPGAVTVSVAASYQDGQGGASAVPLVSNIVYFADGSDNIISGLTALSGVKLQHVAMNRGFRGNIGGGGSSLLLSINSTAAGQYASSVLNYAAGGGTAYVKAASGGIGIVRNNSLGRLFLTGGTINVRAELYSGETNLNDSVDLSGKSVFVYGGDHTIEYKSDGTDPNITVNGGILRLKRPAGTLTINKGTVIADVWRETNMCATLNLNGEGFLDWRAGAIGTAANFEGGSATVRNLRRPTDISGATITLGNSDLDAGFADGAKITWPATTSMVFKSGAAAQMFGRVSATVV